MMDDYSLQSNEVVLYKGEAHFAHNKARSELLLTNINIVIITKTKKMFSKEQVDLQTFPVDGLKIYNDVPQAKRDDCTVELYHVTAEITLEFDTKSEARKFVDAVYKLATGKSKPERGANKFKGAVNLVDNTLGVDTLGAIKNVVENGVVYSILGGVGKKAPGKKDGLSQAAGIAKDLVSKKTGEGKSPKSETGSSLSFDDQIEALKKLKDLLDSGIITQEEFDAKKKQLMGL
jgi:hypothetical protein